MGSTQDNGTISTENFWDLAVNCKKGLMAWYTDYPYYYEDFKINRPDSSIFNSENTAKYEREKPEKVAMKMGKLWWLDNNSYLSDIRDGEYMAWHKQNLRRKQKNLRAHAYYFVLQK